MNDEKIKLWKEKTKGIFHITEYTRIWNYITNLQQAVEVKNERIKEEQQEKERYIKFYNELNIWNKELQQENERLKQNNQAMQEEMARTWQKCDDLQQENEKLKQDYINVKNYIKMRNVSTEVEDKAFLYNIELENINKKKYLDYKSRCEKAISKINDLYSYADNEEYVDNYCKDLLNILQNGSEEK